MRPSQDATATVERKRALVVGVNQARDAQDPVVHTPLHAADDAASVAHALRRYGDFEIWGGRALVNERATARAVQEAIVQLEAESTKDDFLLFYFSGHGLSLRTSDALADETVAETYLATWDFSEMMTRGGLRLSLRWLRDNLYYSARAGRVVIILDSCYAGDLGRVSKPFAEQVRQALDAYFGEPSADTGSLQGGLRQALLATGPAQTTREEQGRGLMTTYLLRALEGEAGEAIHPRTGAVTLTGIQYYFERAMQPGELPTVTGGSAGMMAVLAWHAQRARDLHNWSVLRQQQPHTYLPQQSDTYLQPRARELDGPDSLVTLLAQHRLVGLVGRRGVGKGWLARELAVRCQQADHYPGGIFWMSSGKNDYTSCVQEMELLARRTGYLPPDDDGGRRSDYEEQRARHFCRYLAHTEQALLLIHNLENGHVLQKILPDLAGDSLRCTIIYTALPGAVSGMTTCERRVEPFAEPVALTLLLKDVRPVVLARYEGHLDDDDVRAAQEICRCVDYLPSPLVALRTSLQKDPELSLVRLHTSLQERGILNEVGDFRAFWQRNWEELTRQEQQDFFLLASLSPAQTPIPLWLLELAAGFTQPGVSAQLPGQVYGLLEHLGWLEIEQGAGEQRVTVGQAQKEFAEALLHADPQRAQELKARAARSLLEECTDGDRLQQRCRNREMYWQCLHRQQQARLFAQLLDEAAARAIESVERCLDRGSALLVQEKRWTETLPELFYQYLYNWSVERGTTLTGHTPERWVRLDTPAGNEDRALLRTLTPGGHCGGMTGVAFSPDGQEILTGSRDHHAYLWETATGRLRFPLQEHQRSVTCVAFSADNQLVVTGSRDHTIRVWDRQSGVCKHTWKRHMLGITCLACSTEGLLIAGSNDGRVSAGGLTDTSVSYWQTPLSVSALALAERRGWVIVASGDTVWVWEWAARRPYRLWQRQHARITHLALSPDESVLAFCASDRPRVITLWDCERRVIVQICCGHTASITSLAFVPGQPNWLLSGANDATARLWDAASGQCLATLTGHTAAITGVAGSLDRRLLLTCSREGAAHVWDCEVARQTAGHLGVQEGLSTQAERPAPAECRVLVAPEHTCALVVCGASAQVWSTTPRAYRGQLDVQGADQLAVAAREELLLVRRGQQHEVYTWSAGALRTGEQTAEEAERLWDEHAAAALTLCEDSAAAMQGIPFPGNARYRLAACREGWLTVIDTAATERADADNMPGWPVEAGPITHLSFAPGGRLLAIGDQRGYLQLLAWDGQAPGPLVGLYKAAGQVAALSWLDAARVLLVDINPSGLPPHFHWLSLEGMQPREVWAGAHN